MYFNHNLLQEEIFLEIKLSKNYSSWKISSESFQNRIIKFCKVTKFQNLFIISYGKKPTKF